MFDARTRITLVNTNLPAGRQVTTNEYEKACKKRRADHAGVLGPRESIY